MRWRWVGSSTLTCQALEVAGTWAAKLHCWRRGFLRRTLVASTVQLALTRVESMTAVPACMSTTADRAKQRDVSCKARRTRVSIARSARSRRH